MTDFIKVAFKIPNYLVSRKHNQILMTLGFGKQDNKHKILDLSWHALLLMSSVPTSSWAFFLFLLSINIMLLKLYLQVFKVLQLKKKICLNFGLTKT